MCQPGFGTNLCLAQLTGFVATGRDKQMHTCTILLDLQKAFETLDHEVLLKKMKYFGFRTPVIKWFESYLPYRKFSIYIDNVFFWGLNIKVRCTTRLYPWTAPFSVICKWSTPVIIRRRLLFVCRWHLYFLPTWGPYKNWKCFK